MGPALFRSDLEISRAALVFPLSSCGVFTGDAGDLRSIINYFSPLHHPARHTSKVESRKLCRVLCFMWVLSCGLSGGWLLGGFVWVMSAVHDCAPSLSPALRSLHGRPGSSGSVNLPVPCPSRGAVELRIQVFCTRIRSQLHS